MFTFPLLIFILKNLKKNVPHCRFCETINLRSLCLLALETILCINLNILMMLYNKYVNTSTAGSSEENVLDLPNSYYFAPTSPSPWRINFI